MGSERLRIMRHGLTVAWLAAQVSCATAPVAVRQKQASDGMRGGGNIAMAAFRCTAVAAIRQPVTTTKLGFAFLWNRPLQILHGKLPFVASPDSPIAEEPGTPEFERLLDRRHFPVAEAGTLDWLIDGSGFFPELGRRIATARESIKIQTFIFDNDDIAVRCADALKRRSGEVPVQVLFDDLGSMIAANTAPATLGPLGFVPPPDMRDYLRDGDSKVRARRILTPWLAADHTKLIIFDKHTAYLGGMNIGREYFSEWHDIMVRVEGPVVASLCREFNRAWRKAGPWGDFALVRSPKVLRRPKPVPAGIPLRVLRTDPAEGRHEILQACLLAIRGARHRVWIETPYFMNAEIVDAVTAAARRGVDVRVVIPAGGESVFLNVANLSTADGLIRAGGKVFHFPIMTHAKIMVCDDWACVGSANLDNLSLRINRELNIAFSHRTAVQKLANKILLPDFHRSVRIRSDETEPYANGFVRILADQF